MANLINLGFLKSVIVETIVTTYSLDGKPNAAPMGVMMENEKSLSITLFKSSLTYKNFQSCKCAIVNLTSDINTFYLTAFKEANPQGILPLGWFEKGHLVNAPKLCAAEATVEISATEFKPIDNQKTQVFCDVKLINAVEAPFKAYNRAFSATLEAIIHATRFKVFIKDKNQQEHLAKLAALIQNCQEIVNKTAPNSQYSDIMVDLVKRINLWKGEK